MTNIKSMLLSILNKFTTTFVRLCTYVSKKSSIFAA